MLLSSIAALIAVAFGTGAAGQACTTIKIRKEWSELTAAQQKSYLDAVVKLQHSPSKLPASAGSKSRFHDFAPPESDLVFNDATFGKDGDPQTGCVTTGRFTDFTSQFGFPGYCLQRQYTQTSLPNGTIVNQGLRGFSNSYSSASVHGLMSIKTYDRFRTLLEGGPHGSVHNGIDPLFALHHCNIDRIWAVWQKVVGPSIGNSYNGLLVDGVTRASPTDPLDLFGLNPGARNKTAAQVMSTTGPGLCYQYSNSISLGLGLSGNVNHKRDSNTKSEIRYSAYEIATAADPYDFGVRHGITPAQHDRTDQYRLRCPPRLSESMAREMHFSDADIAEVRKFENKECAFINYLNHHHRSYTHKSSIHHIRHGRRYSRTNDEVDLERNTMDLLRSAYNDAATRQ
eukprot:jgi/Hompol1/2927/HPOL_001490-RA